ncbi:MAG: GNAT family N-acetyltransferase [Actinomycetota bacterium]
MDIRPLDPLDDTALRAWHATYLASTTHDRPHATPWMLEEVRADLTSDRPGEKAHAFSGVVDGRVAAAGMVELPLKDNLTKAWLQVDTLPELRRRGYGAAMLEHLTEFAREHERAVLLAEAAYPFDAPADGGDHPHAVFLRQHGFTFGLGDVQRVLDLPADTAVLRGLAKDAEPFHTGYGIRQFRGAVPEDIVEAFGELIGQLVVEAPMGEIDLEPEVLDVQRIRADEVMFAQSGRMKYTTVAVAPDGVLAGYTELVVPAHDPGRVYQWGTLVRRDHRGHRLGQALKARNLLWLQDERPDLRLLTTYNAEVNSHMIGVNDKMGFRPVERLGEFQKHL